MLRPGGTVAGPMLMSLADTAMWAAVLGAVGPVAMTVTTHLDIDFLRFAGPNDVVAEARLLKLGRRLAVGDVLMTAEGATRTVRAGIGHVFDPAVILGRTRCVRRSGRGMGARSVARSLRSPLWASRKDGRS